MKTILGHQFSAKDTNNMLKRSLMQFRRSLKQVYSFIQDLLITNDIFCPQRIETTIKSLGQPDLRI
jgi:hypothetical protein